MLDEISWLELCKTFLTRKSFCELVMICKTKEALCIFEDNDMTDEQFLELQHLAHLALLRDDFAEEVYLDRSIYGGHNE